MRDDPSRSSFSALTWLIVGIAAGFVLENIFLRWFSPGAGELFMRAAALSVASLKTGFVWTFFTHAFVHDPNSLLHLAFTLLMLFGFGRVIAPSLGQRRLLAVFFSAVAVGGVAWLAINWNSGGLHYGASAGVSAFIVIFGCLMPYQPIAPFMVDIGLRARHLIIALLVIHGLGLILLEIPGKASWFAMSHSAHLGGMLTGWLYFRLLHESSWRFGGFTPTIELPRWFRRSRKASSPAPACKVNIQPRPDNMRAEVDRILDKINSSGFHSLTDGEKRLLDEARDHLSRR